MSTVFLAWKLAATDVADAFPFRCSVINGSDNACSCFPEVQSYTRTTPEHPPPTSLVAVELTARTELRITLVGYGKVTRLLPLWSINPVYRSLSAKTGDPLLSAIHTAFATESTSTLAVLRTTLVHLSKALKGRFRTIFRGGNGALTMLCNSHR